ncbi:helix-turn-helix domain-containing protein [Vagococcus zengguangii]|nr:helix-turn-helix domain-containing protein [Vagococcus zengguangii]
MIEKLLDNEDAKKYKVVKFIQKQRNRYISIEEIIAETGISSKKIKEIINEIEQDENEIYPNCSKNQINYHKKMVIKSTDYNPYHYLKFYLKRSLKYKWLEDIFLEKQINLEEEALEYHISTSTIYRRWKEFKRDILDMGLSIKKTARQRYRISGEEPTIRYLYYRIFMLIDCPIPLNKELEDETYHYLVNQNYGIAEGSIISFQTMLAVTIQRSLKNPINSTKKNDFSLIEFKYSRDLFLERFFKFFKKYGRSETVISKELDFLFFFLTTENTHDISEFKNEVMDSTELSDCKYFNILTDFKNEIIEKRFELNLNNAELFCFYVNTYYGLRRNDLFKNAVNIVIEGEMPIAFECFKEKIKDYQFYHMLPLKQLFILLEPIMKLEQKVIKILLINRNGDLVTKEIERMIEEEARFSPVFSKRLLDKPDIVISDGPLLEYTSLPVFYLSQLPNKFEILSIVEEIHERFEKKTSS